LGAACAVSSSTTVNRSPPKTPAMRLNNTLVTAAKSAPATKSTSPATAAP